ncbi:MAG: molybdopterin oxidoreductase, iron-sulfur binding subunit, partial [Proteobacteria bacterium]|nr:molybdopterin oxidoreductase, iron-sulfur binding subunit [Pseudomonadota bacterium]
MNPPDISSRVEDGQSERQWRSLEEWAGTDECRAFLGLEFPYLAQWWDVPVKRREMLKLMAASLALAGIDGCSRQPAEEIVPYVRAPERMVPGKPLYYATALTLGGFARGVLVESHMGRPIKVEGNPLHPASLGATDVFAQASVLGLYDPDRSQIVTNGREASTWEAFRTVIAGKRGEWAARKGAGLYLLTETVTSPTLGHQLGELLKAYPRAHWHQYDPVGRDPVRAGAVLAFGEYVETHYRFDQARVIVSLDADFLAGMPGHVRYAHDFAAGRRVRRGQAAMSRLYAIESTPTLTGAMADHRLPLQAGYVEGAARAMARDLGMEIAQVVGKLPLPGGWLAALATDLKRHAGECLVVAGDHQPAIVHALAHAMNERLGNFGRTVLHTEPVEIEPTAQWQSMALLVDDMKAGVVDSLFILGGNPVFDAPVDLAFAEALAKVPLRVHWGHYADETAEQCQWHIPAPHELEIWGDARAHDGTVSLLQPLMAPIHGGRSLHEVLALLTSETPRSDHDIVQDYWRARHSGPDFDGFWKRALREGLVPDTAAPPKAVSVRSDLARALPPPRSIPEAALEIQFRPDPTLRDGRHANNGWLQELPKPLTQLTWANPALLSPKTAD